MQMLFFLFCAQTGGQSKVFIFLAAEESAQGALGGDRERETFIGVSQHMVELSTNTLLVGGDPY